MIALSRRALLIGGTAMAAAATSATIPGLTTAAAAPPSRPAPSRGAGPDRSVLHRWARDTWASLVAMTDEKTGLSADNIDGPLASPHRSGYTSPTNIGGYLWSRDRRPGARHHLPS